MKNLLLLNLFLLIFSNNNPMLKIIKRSINMKTLSPDAYIEGAKNITEDDKIAAIRIIKSL